MDVDAPPRDLTDSAFVGDLVGELVGDHYSRQAWRRFWRRAFRRAWTNVRARPRRVASTVLWLAGALALGVAVLVVAYSAPGSGAAAPAAACWAVWFALTGAWIFLHQGLVRTDAGVPFDRLLLPNGLSAWRLLLAPLMAEPILALASAGPHPAAGWLIAFAALLALTDLLDGLAARGLGQCTRLGRILDPMADVAFLCWLGVGLVRAGLLPGWALALLLVRYPGAIVGAIVLFFVHGPVHVTSTWPGKVANFAVSVIFVLAAAAALTRPVWLDVEVVRGALLVAAGLIAFNLAWLLWCARSELRRPPPRRAAG